MRIWLVEISDFLPEIDGLNRMYRVGMLYKALVGSGHEVVWWSSTFNHQRRLQRFDKDTTLKQGVNCRIRLLYGPGYRRSVSLKRWLHNRAVGKAFAFESRAVSEDSRPDIIYSCLPTLEVSEQAVLFGMKWNIPVVIDIRELWPDNYLTPFPKVLRPVVQLALRNEYSRAYRILHFATAITASSQAYLKWGLHKAKREVSAIDCWFPLGSSANAALKLTNGSSEKIRLANGTVLPEGSFVITYVGTFTKLFDFDTVIDVAAKLYRSGQEDVHFVLVGDGSRTEHIKKRSEGLRNFHMTGWCQKPEIDKILAVSSIGLAPYSFEFEPTLPNKPFEYMAAGKPLLSSLGGELQEIILQERIGLNYCCGDVFDLKEKILYLLSHPEEVEGMGRRANALFEKRFRSDVVYTGMVHHLERIAKNRRRVMNAA